MYNFPIKEVGKEFIKISLRVSVDPEIIKGIGDCTCDKKARVLTTPKYIEDAGKKEAGRRCVVSKGLWSQEFERQ